MLKAVKFTLFTVVPVIQDVFLILIIIRGVARYRKRKTTRRGHVISLHPRLFWTGAVCGATFCVPLTLFGPDEAPPGDWFLFEIFVLVSITMMLAYCNEMIRYERLKFTVSNLFGKEHTYYYTEITGLIHRRSGDTIIRCGRRKIRVDAMAAGSDEFLTIVLQELNRREQR